MRRMLVELGGIVAAAVVFWAGIVLVGLAVLAVWPPEGSHSVGVSLDPRSLPGMVAGFVGALYAFRAVTRPREKSGRV